MAERRARRRDAERRAHPIRNAKESGRAMDIEALVDPGDDPPEFLETRRLALIKALLTDASETEDRELRARICVNLLKLSSMGRTSLDLVHSLKRDELPDLSRLFQADELAALVEAPPETLMRLAERIATRERDQDGEEA
jgi:hypothetical protein